VPWVPPYQLDIVDNGSIDKFSQHLEKEYGGIDILVNNAGIAAKGDAFDEHIARNTIGTNYFGTLNVLLKLLPLVKKNGRVVNVSSSAGKLSILSPDLQKKFTDPDLTIDGVNSLMNQFIQDVKENTYAQKGWPKTTYGISKVGLTAITRVLAHDEQYKNKGILINAVCPGWCRTDMAGPRAPLTPNEGAETPCLLATLPEASTSTGEFWKDKKPVQW